MAAEMAKRAGKNCMFRCVVVGWSLEGWCLGRGMGFYRVTWFVCLYETLISAK